METKRTLELMLIENGSVLSAMAVRTLGGHEVYLSIRPGNYRLSDAVLKDLQLVGNQLERIVSDYPELLDPDFKEVE